MYKSILLLSILLLSIPSCLAFQNSEQTHPFSVHDMLAMDRISDPKVSPDGKRVVSRQTKDAPTSG